MHPNKPHKKSVAKKQPHMAHKPPHPGGNPGTIAHVMMLKQRRPRKKK